MRWITRTLAATGLAAAAALGSTTGPAGAAEAEEARALGECWVIPPGRWGCYAGPYRDKGTCNYWRGGMGPDYWTSPDCYWGDSGTGVGWIFAYGPR